MDTDTLMTGMISLETYHGSTVSIICENSVLKHTTKNVSIGTDIVGKGLSFDNFYSGTS